MGEDGEGSLTNLNPSHESDSTNYVVWAQVKHSGGKYGVQEDSGGNILRTGRHPRSQSTVVLGDVAEMLIKVFGAHETPRFRESPGFDEQRWILEIRDSELVVVVESRPYWGFGLFNRCFLNKITLNGPIRRKARLIYDLVTVLGRKPWAPFWKRAWEKATSLSNIEHTELWEKLIDNSNANLNDRIKEMKGLVNSAEEEIDEKTTQTEEETIDELLEQAKNDIQLAESALKDKNSTAVERALDRIELVLIKVDPSIDLKSNPFNEMDDVLESGQIVDGDLLELSEIIVDATKIVENTNDLEMNDGTEEIDAEWLLENQEEHDDEIPFIDLSEQFNEEE